mmetsp:Transcript_10952/g.32880  ORF Transcript_10952/g.32880 Transcript_10952/m.32880 type:complete len:299 (+) Transcript_10952:262-1158(+)
MIVSHAVWHSLVHVNVASFSNNRFNGAAIFENDLTYLRLYDASPRKDRICLHTRSRGTEPSHTGTGICVNASCARSVGCSPSGVLLCPRKTNVSGMICTFLALTEYPLDASRSKTATNARTCLSCVSWATHMSSTNLNKSRNMNSAKSASDCRLKCCPAVHMPSGNRIYDRVPSGDVNVTASLDDHERRCPDGVTKSSSAICPKPSGKPCRRGKSLRLRYSATGTSRPPTTRSTDENRRNNEMHPPFPVFRPSSVEVVQERPMDSDYCPCARCRRVPRRRSVVEGTPTFPASYGTARA